MAGLAATRLFAAAGAGGVALTAWALRRSGMEPRAGRLPDGRVHGAAVRGLRGRAAARRHRRCATGLFPGGGSFAITVIPAIAAAVLFAVAGAMALLPGDIERRLGAGRGLGPACASGRPRGDRARRWRRAACARRSRLIRARDPGLLGALAWWGFDIAVLWAMFHAFGSPPPFTRDLMAYFVGMLGNLLPLPGGLGGVEGGMIGAFAAFGVPLQPGGAGGALLPRDLLLAAHPARRRRLLPAAPHGRALARGAGGAAARGRAPAGGAAALCSGS